MDSRNQKRPGQREPTKMMVGGGQGPGAELAFPPSTRTTTTGSPRRILAAPAAGTGGGESRQGNPRKEATKAAGGSERAWRR